MRLQVAQYLYKVVDDLVKVTSGVDMTLISTTKYGDRDSIEITVDRYLVIHSRGEDVPFLIYTKELKPDEVLDMTDEKSIIEHVKVRLAQIKHSKKNGIGP